MSSASHQKYVNTHFPVPEPCAANEIRSVENNTCVKIPYDLVLPKGTFGKRRLRKDNIVIHFYYVVLYFLQKYQNLAMLLPMYKTHDPIPNHAIVFSYDEKMDAENEKLSAQSKAKDPYKLTFPNRWPKFIERAMENDRIRFIAAYLAIRGKHNTNHANMIVIDKHQKKVYRFEPNTGVHEDEEDNWGNGPELDRALSSYFEDATPDTKGNHWTHSSYKYVDADSSCPRGLHRYEWYEHSKTTLDTDGNCALWAIFMLDLRLANPDVPTKDLFQYGAQEISKTGSFKYFVDAYADNVLRIGKEYRLMEAKREKKEREERAAAKRK
jgi:hypothetical protein